MRRWRRANRAVLHRALEDSPLCRPVPADADVDELFTVYDCRALRRECRRLERRYRRTHSVANRRQWVDALRHRLRVYRDKKEQYWTDCIAEHDGSSPMLWRSLSSMLARDRNVTGASGHTADGFAAFFSRKVEDVMAAQ